MRNIYRQSHTDIAEENYHVCMVGWLVEYYDISTFVGYLMPNLILYKLSVVFQTIQFSMSKQFNCQKHFYFKLFSLVKQFYFKQFSFG